MWQLDLAGSGAGIDVLAVWIIRSLNSARKGIPVSGKGSCGKEYCFKQASYFYGYFMGSLWIMSPEHINNMTLKKAYVQIWRNAREG